MNPVKLKFRHGGEMLVSPIGLRFVEDPEHGPLVLIPELPGPRGYQLDMTLEEAEQAYRDAASMQPFSNFASVKLEGLEKKIEAVARRLSDESSWRIGFLEEVGLEIANVEGRADVVLRGTKIKASFPDMAGAVAELEKKLELLGRRVPLESQVVEDRIRISEAIARTIEHSHLIGLIQADLKSALNTTVFSTGLHKDDYKRWQALAIRLGLPEGWEHLHEGAAEVKGALVSQAELIDKLEYSVVNCARWCGSFEQRLAAVEKELSLLKEEASLFTLAERVGELEESRRAAFQRLCDAELRLHSLEDRHRQMTNEAEGFRRDVENDRVCVQRQTTGPIEITWTHAGPCNAATGQPIECSSWRAPEKPKSAWKPLTGEERTPGQKVLIRLAGTPQMMWIAVPSPAGYRVGTDVRWTLELDRFDGYEFCPIPE